MNNDLISREVLRKALEEDMKYGGVKTDEFDKGYDIGIKAAIEMLDNATPVDIKDEIAGAYNEGYMCGNKEAEKARPHGCWKRGEFGSYCSICGYAEYRYLGTGPKHDHNFCPECGADMRCEANG